MAVNWSDGTAGINKHQLDKNGKYMYINNIPDIKKDTTFKKKKFNIKKGNN